MGFVLKVDERDDKMGIADMNWAIKMDFNVCKELTEIALEYIFVQLVTRW